MISQAEVLITVSISLDSNFVSRREIMGITEVGKLLRHEHPRLILKLRFRIASLFQFEASVSRLSISTREL